MKNYIVAIVSLICVTMSAQKIIEKDIKYNGQRIEVEVPFAKHIEVKTWDKPNIYFKADLTTEEGKHLDLYKLNIDEGSSQIKIESDPTDIFKKSQKEYADAHPNKDGNYYNNFEYTFNYVLYVPKNAKFKVKSINGNLDAEVIEGDFTADLINGYINIKKYSGILDLSTINGEIDLKMVDTKMHSETINGNIFADESMNLKSEDRHVGQEVSGSFGNGTNDLRLKTINGYIYLRK